MNSSYFYRLLAALACTALSAHAMHNGMPPQPASAPTAAANTDTHSVHADFARLAAQTSHDLERIFTIGVGIAQNNSSHNTHKS